MVKHTKKLEMFKHWSCMVSGSLFQVFGNRKKFNVNLQPQKRPLVFAWWPWPCWLVVSTHLKNISQNGNLPQIGVKIKHIWNHHLACFEDLQSFKNYEMTICACRSAPVIRWGCFSSQLLLGRIFIRWVYFRLMTLLHIWGSRNSKPFVDTLGVNCSARDPADENHIVC